MHYGERITSITSNVSAADRDDSPLAPTRRGKEIRVEQRSIDVSLGEHSWSTLGPLPFARHWCNRTDVAVLDPPTLPASRTDEADFVVIDDRGQIWRPTRRATRNRLPKHACRARVHGRWGHVCSFAKAVAAQTGREVGAIKREGQTVAPDITRRADEGTPPQSLAHRR